MSQKRVLTMRPNDSHGGLQAYVIGFVLSIILTVLAYWLTVHHALGTNLLVVIVVSLALLQFAVQLVFFLHLSQESRPRWRLVTFGFMTLVVMILVFGSLWIMKNLNYHQVSPIQMQQNEGL